MKLDFPKLYRDKLLKIENLFEKDVLEMTVDELRIATIEERVSPNRFERLDEDIQEGIKKLNKEANGWSEEETEVRYKIASDNILIPSFNSLLAKNIPLETLAKNYVEMNLGSYLPNKFVSRNYDDVVSKYSKIVIDAYNQKRITI
jgi:hypothetical protein